LAYSTSAVLECRETAEYVSNELFRLGYRGFTEALIFEMAVYMLGGLSLYHVIPEHLHDLHNLEDYERLANDTAEEIVCSFRRMYTKGFMTDLHLKSYTHPGILHVTFNVNGC